MPEMTGLQLQENLEAQGLCVPVIFVTAYDTPQTREHARKAGCSRFLLKPFDNEELLRAIRRRPGANRSPLSSAELGASAVRLRFRGGAGRVGARPATMSEAAAG